MRRNYVTGQDKANHAHRPRCEFNQAKCRGQGNRKAFPGKGQTRATMTDRRIAEFNTLHTNICKRCTYLGAPARDSRVRQSDCADVSFRRCQGHLCATAT